MSDDRSAIPPGSAPREDRAAGDPGEAEPRAIEQIFALRGVVPPPDPARPSDATVTEMVRLAARPPDERDEALEPHLAAWLEAGRSRIEIATYLALAGLTLEEAEALALRLRARVRAQWSRQAWRWFFHGLALALASPAALLLRPHPWWAVLLAGGLIAAAACFRRAGRCWKRITPPDEPVFR